MSRGIQVSVAMSFGILEAKNRKFRFVFDAAALGETEPAPRSLTPNPDAGNSRGRGEGSRLSTSRYTKWKYNYAARSKNPECTLRNHVDLI